MITIYPIYFRENCDYNPFFEIPQLLHHHFSMFNSRSAQLQATGLKSGPRGQARVVVFQLSAKVELQGNLKWRISRNESKITCIHFL